MPPADWTDYSDLEIMRRCRRGLRQAQLSHQQLAPAAVPKIVDPAALVVGRDSFSVRYRWIVWGVANSCFVSQTQLAEMFARDRKGIAYGLRKLEKLTREDSSEGAMMRQIFLEVQKEMIRGKR